MTLLFLTAGVLSLCGCSLFETEVHKGYAEGGNWPSEARVYTTADVRMVALREHPVTKQKVVCTEPSPDVAKAISTATQLSLQGGSKAGASGQVGLAGSTAEAVAELAGRSTALIALRDGLYRACEAYANGAIGSDAYALVLSRYGQLMATLFLGEDIRGAAAANSASVQSPVINLSLSGSGTQNQSPTTPSGTDKASSTGAVKKSSYREAPSGGLGGLVDVVNRKTPAPAGAPPSTVSTPPPSKQDTPGTQPIRQNPSNPQGQNASAGGGTSAVAAVALVRLEEDFRDLDADILNQLLVACVNEFDPTRERGPVNASAGAVQLTDLADPPQHQSLQPPPAGSASQDPVAMLVAALQNAPTSLYGSTGENAWLRKVCPALASVRVLTAAQGVVLQTSATAGHPAADVRPDAGLTLQTNNPKASDGASVQ